MVEHFLPIEVGQIAESRSNICGFRGAWFRCKAATEMSGKRGGTEKIKKIAKRHGEPYVAMEYFDFPDEKILWTKLYQKIPSVAGKAKKSNRLMVRPSFPPVYHKREKPDTSNISEVAVIVEDEWKVGDLVDWWTDGCYWSGRVSNVLNDEKLQIELPPPPEGEGLTYVVCSKELRPSLEWSPESGWTLPTIKVGEQNRHCARLIKPVNEGRPVDSSVACETHIRAGGSLNDSFSSQTQSRSSSSQLEPIPESPTESPLSTTNSTRALQPSGSAVQKTSSSDTLSASDVQKVEKRVAASLEKLKRESTIRLNSTFSNTLEDAILDLENLASHVRMLQDILKVGMPPNSRQSSLKIPGSSAPSPPK